MLLKIDHVGWITNNVNKFEKFWVDILGFEKVWESHLSEELAKTLFGVNYGAKCLRYKKDEIVIEVHSFDQLVNEEEQIFVKYGINHIALFVPSREEFLKQFNFNTHIYHNPGGWDNIFIQDFEGNWIELKEKL
jgi:catechol 2,3-dioxygenase-like lactoylglutathione lyase family enzyme